MGSGRAWSPSRAVPVVLTLLWDRHGRAQGSSALLLCFGGQFFTPSPLSISWALHSLSLAFHKKTLPISRIIQLCAPPHPPQMICMRIVSIKSEQAINSPLKQTFLHPKAPQQRKPCAFLTPQLWVSLYLLMQETLALWVFFAI